MLHVLALSNMKKQIILLVAAAYVTSCSTTPSSPEVVLYDAQPGQSIERDPAAVAGEQIVNHGGDKLGQIDWHDLFSELNYANQLKMSSDNNDFNNRLHNSNYYTAAGFNAAYAKVMTAKTTKQAFHIREDNMSVGPSFVNKMNQYSELKKAGTLGGSALVQQILRSAGASVSDPREKLTEQNNYFTSATGSAVSEVLKDYVIIVVPGFASHTVKDYTWPEILRQANKFYGRPLTRPEIKTGAKTDYQKMEDFYGKRASVGFDVVHPMGYELGFSMGADAESGSALAAWIVRLKKIPAYANKKFVLIGYSKGTPISVNAFVNHPEAAESIAAILTMSGVAQGAIPANTFVKEAYQRSGATSKQALVSYLAQRLQAAQAKVQQAEQFSKNLLVASGANEQFLNKTEDVAKALLTRGGIGMNAEDQQSVADQRKLIEGIVDMSNYESLQWNLKNYNNEKFSKPVTIFNMSMVANVKDMVRPNSAQTSLTPPLIVPQFATENSIEYSKFSKDDVFLYMTSLSGFEEAPGGLFDAQVGWLDTKSMALDARPLSHSLDARQLAMFKTSMAQQGVALPAGFERLQRRQLLAQIAAQHGGLSNLNFINVGDFRGTHWDCAFEQVYKPSLSETQDYYKHQFPRRALQSSVIEMLAIYKQLGGL